MNGKGYEVTAIKKLLQWRQRRRKVIGGKMSKVYEREVYPQLLTIRRLEMVKSFEPVMIVRAEECLAKRAGEMRVANGDLSVAGSE
jgi:hypothetical protein